MARTVFRNANVIGYTGRQDLEIVDGVLVRIAPTLPGTEGTDLKGRVVSPRFVDSHMHLDKAMVPCDEDPCGLLEAIRRSMTYFDAIPADRLVENITQRSDRLIQMALRAGTGTIKTNLTIGGALGWASMESLCLLRERYRRTMRLLSAVRCEVGEEEEFDRRVKAGQIDFIAGYPSLARDFRRELDRIFALALKYDLPIDLHVDESDQPNIDCFLYLLEKTIQTGLSGRVTCGHLTALSAPGLSEDEVKRAIELAVRAEVSVTTLTSCNLYLMSDARRDPTCVKRLMEAGVPVSIASDNARDPLRPYGNADLLQEALLTAQVHKLAGENQLTQVFRMITENPAANCLISDYGLREGCRADFVLLDAQSPAQAILRGGGVLLRYADGSLLETEQPF